MHSTSTAIKLLLYCGKLWFWNQQLLELRAVRGFESARRGKSKVSLYIYAVKHFFFFNEHVNF